MQKTSKISRLLAALLAVLMLSIGIPTMAFATDGTSDKKTFTVSFVTEADGTLVTKGPYELGEVGDMTYADFCEKYNIEVPGDYELSEPDTIFNLNGSVSNVKVPIQPVADPEPTEKTFTVSFVTEADGVLVTKGPYKFGEVGDMTYADFCEKYNIEVPGDYELSEPDTIFNLNGSVSNVQVPIQPVADPEPTEKTFTVSFVTEADGVLVTKGPYEFGEVGDMTYADFCEKYNIKVPGDYELSEPDTIFNLNGSVSNVQVPIQPVADPEPTEKTFTVSFVTEADGVLVTKGPYEFGEIGDMTYADFCEKYNIKVPGDYELSEPDTIFNLNESVSNVQVPIQPVADPVPTKKTAVFRKAADDVWNENSDNPDEVYYTFWSFDPDEPCTVPSITTGDKSKALDYWVCDLDETVTLQPGEDFCYNDLDQGKLQGSSGDFAFYPVYKDVATTDTDTDTNTDTNTGNTDSSTNTTDTTTTTNTATATSSDNSKDEVVKASAPADNNTKILPQTGNQGVVSPVSFVVVLCAALAGAAVYLFAIRKKLN